MSYGPRMLRSAIFVVLGLLTGLAACGDDDETDGSGGSGGEVSGGCEVDPSQCAAGTTCWVNDALTAFSCEPSGATGENEVCVNQSGEPTCSDGLYCLQVQGTTEARCTPACNPHDPPADCSCARATIADTELSFYACAPSSSGGGGAGG